MPDRDPHRNFRFQLEIEGVDVQGFHEVSGLSSEYEVIVFREGGEPQTIRKIPGLRRFGDVTLKRGIVGDKALWEWHASIERNPGDRRNVVIALLNAEGEPVCRWLLSGAWPARYEGPTFDAEGNEVALETLVLAHQGLALEVS